MGKFDYRKLQALENELVAFLQKNPSANDDFDAIETFDFSLLLQRIKSEMREIRLQMISQIPAGRSKTIPSVTKDISSPGQEVERRSSEKSAPAEASLEKARLSTSELTAKISSEPLAETALPSSTAAPARSLNASLTANVEVKPRLPAKTRITRVVSEKADPGIFSVVFLHLRNPWFTFSAVIALLMVTILLINIFSDYPFENNSLPGNNLNSIKNTEKNITSIYPSVVKHNKQALEAYEKGRQEMQKSNPNAAREYLRLALSINPGDQMFLQALKEVDRQILKQKEKK